MHGIAPYRATHMADTAAHGPISSSAFGWEGCPKDQWNLFNSMIQISDIVNLYFRNKNEIGYFGVKMINKIKGEYHMMKDLQI